MLTITPAHEALLHSFTQLHMLTAEQLRCLLAPDGSVKTMQAKLKLLESHGYLQHDAIPTKATKPSYYYVLDTEGMRWLKNIGVDVNPSFRTEKEMHTSPEFIEHTLEINDILIAAILFNKLESGYSFHGFLHERALKQRPCCFEWHNKDWKVIPDGFLQFYKDSSRLSLLLEHDRGTEWQMAVRKKIRSYIGMFQTKAYTERFKAKAVMVIFTTFHGSKRRDQLREWTYEELKAQEATNLSTHFLFTT